jgi:hypothetical protein
VKPEIWAQIKNITADKLISALEKDGWKLQNMILLCYDSPESPDCSQLWDKNKNGSAK